MQILKEEAHIDFLGKRFVAVIFSLCLIAGTIASLIFHGGPNYGIDFEGGSLVQVKFAEAVEPKVVREALASADVGEFAVQEFGSPKEILINMEGTEKEVPVNIAQEDGAEVEEGPGEKVKRALKEAFGDRFTVERVEMVGPKVGSDLREKALMAIIYALIGILIYITLRFELKFGLAAIVALLHDTVITIGAFSVFDKEFTLPVIAALLTVIGYSLNDTIVVFDRIRENLKLKRGMDTIKILNVSINQTLSRTLLTSGTTLAVVLSIFFLGGEVIHDFSFALLIGVLIGTYSSIFVASPLLLLGKGLSKKK